MELETAVKGMLSAEEALRNAQAIGSPAILSEQMMRLASYLGAVEQHLAWRRARLRLSLEDTLGGAIEVRPKLALRVTSIPFRDWARISAFHPLRCTWGTH